MSVALVVRDPPPGSPEPGLDAARIPVSKEKGGNGEIPLGVTNVGGILLQKGENGGDGGRPPTGTGVRRCRTRRLLPEEGLPQVAAPAPVRDGGRVALVACPPVLRAGVSEHWWASHQCHPTLVSNSLIP